jgi:hypothetical protein
MKTIMRLALVSALVAVGVSGAAATTSAPNNLVLARALNIELGLVTPGPHEQLVSSGPLYAVLQASGVLDDRANAVQGGNAGGPNSAGCGQKFAGGGTGASVNTRVNQDCSLRRQAEEVIAVNPTNAVNLIAGQNDSRIGFNHCGYDFSFDGGKTWGDQVPPFWQFQLMDGHTSDACSDPTATFDSQGNAYAAGIVFNASATSPANAIVVAKSNKEIGGAFYHSPKVQSFQTYRDVPLGVVANDISPTIFNDKELMTADATATSPKANNVYVTWTRFDTTTNNSRIFFSQSTNGGDTWSAGVPISGNNPVICTVASTVPGDCDQDQGSDPTVGRDGTIYVTFGNANSPGAGLNQVLFVRCPKIGFPVGTTNCSNSSNWSTPVKVGDLIDNAPVGPNSATGCPSGRECLPPNGYRVPEFTSDTVSVDSSGRLYVTWADFRNGGPPCTGPASTASPPCDNDVFYAFSTNGGATWSATKKVTPAGSAQWQPWSDVTADGSTLWIAYYDRQYGNCEFSGCNDITLAKVTNPATASPTLTFTRLTTSSMPNLVPANNPLQAGFLGDYMGVDVLGNGRPNVVWADTRGRNDAVEEDIYYATTP